MDLLTWLIPLLVPVVIAGIKWVIPSIPTVWLPILAPLLGAAIDLVAYWAGRPGVDPAVGAVLGAAGVGLREIYDQVKQRVRS